MKLHPFLLIILLSLVFATCKKAEDKHTPLLTTLQIEANGDLSVTAAGRIYAEGGGEITECGFCWSKKIDPTIDGNHVTVDLNGPVFTQTISNLDPFTLYFVRAYATNKYGTTYGTSEQVKSGAAPQPPTLATNSLLKMSTTTFTMSGEMFSNVKQIREAGVVWNTTGNPTTSDNKSSTTTFSNTSFTTSVQGLQPNTIIFARAFATNVAGTSYGATIVLRTYFGTMTDHEGNTYFTTLINGKEWMAENLRCTSFSNGTKIPKVSDNFSWSQTNYSPAYCNMSSTGTISANEGLFYNTAVYSGSNSVIPAGWHLPTKTECDNLINSFNFSQNAAYCLMHPSTGTWPDSFYPSQLTGFDAKFYGYRTYGGYYSSQNGYSYFAVSGSYVTYIYYSGGAYTYFNSPGDGYCIRLVKD